MRTAVKPNKFKKIRSMLDLSTKDKGDTYFLRDEMEVIVYSILGKRVECTDTNSFFHNNLSSLGFKKQVTIDSHPTLENVNFLINAIDQKRKEREGSVVFSRTKRNRSRRSINNVISATPISSVPLKRVQENAIVNSELRTSEISLTDVLIRKIESQDVQTLSFNGKTFNITFK